MMASGNESQRFKEKRVSLEPGKELRDAKRWQEGIRYEMEMLWRG